MQTGDENVSFESSEEKAKLLVISNSESRIPEVFSDRFVVREIREKDLSYNIQGLLTLRQLVNGIPVPIFLRDLNGLFIGSNPSFVEFLGMSEEELIGKTVYDIVPEDEASEYDQRDKELIQSPQIQVYEGKITNKSGKVIDTIFRKSLLVNEDNEPIAIVGVIIDISKRKKIERSNWEYRNKLEDMVLDRTAHLSRMNEQLKNEIELRKQSESALRESEQLFRTIFNSTYDGIILHDVDGKIIDANDKVLEMFSIEKLQINQYTILNDFSAPENDKSEIAENWQKALLGEEAFFGWKAKKPGQEATFDTEVYLRKIQLGQKELILANIRNITERKTVEKLLLQEHNKVKIALKHEMLISTVATILNSTDNFFEVLDNLLYIIENTMHLSSVSMFSLNPDNIGEYTRKPDILFNNEEYKSTINYIMDNIRSNQSIYITQPSEQTDNLKRILKENNASALAVIPLKIPGTVLGALIFMSDVSIDWSSKHYSVFITISNMIANTWERYILNKQRIEAEKQSIETIKLLESSSKLASIGVMAAGITHEINQPLNAIKIHSDGILFWNKRNQNVLPEFFLQKIGKITQAVNRIDSIIKHMRSFWVPNSKKTDEIFDINRAVLNAIDMVQSQVNSHGILLRTKLSENVLNIQGDIIHLEQIVMNLTVNAMHALDKADGSNKDIIIKTYKSYHKAVLSIEDNGPGIADEIKEKLFDPFYSTKKPGEGMGLGLAIVKQFVDNFKGEVRVFNNPETGGAVFEISFPM
jgi:PAS domain S-box-containing protein